LSGRFIDVEVGRTLGKGRFAEVKSISKLSSTSDSERIEKGESNDIVPMMRLDRNNFPSSSRNNSLLSDKDSKYQRYALKELRGSLSNSTRFVGAIDLAKEARFLLALSHHPNIVSLHYTGKDPGSRDYFIVIEELETTFDILIHKEWKILYDKKGSCRSHENTGNCIEKKKPRKKVLEDSRRELLKIRLETMLGIASAFEFLHAKQ
jgi:serine/threonine protein kinase